MPSKLTEASVTRDYHVALGSVDPRSGLIYSRELDIVRTLLLSHAAIRRRNPATPLLNALALLLFAKVTATCVALVAGSPIAPPDAPLAASTHLLLFVGFAGAGGLLALGGQRDARARYLGSFYAIVSLAFAREPLRQVFVHTDHLLASVLRIDCDPLLPLFLWLFVREFPRTTSQSGQWVVNAAVLAATAWAAFATLHGVSVTSPEIAAFQLGTLDFESFYWIATFALTMLALPIPYARSRSVTQSERTRVTWFTTGLLLGLAPLSVEVIAANVSSGYRAWSASPLILPALGFVVSSALLTIPLTTLYAVGSHRVVTVSFALRRALQCTLLKHLSLAVAVSPILSLVVMAYVHRSESVAYLTQDVHIRVLLGLSVVGLFVLAFADRLLRFIDGLFFRPAYVPQRVVATVSGEMTRAANYAAVADRAAAALYNAFDPITVRVAVLTRGQGDYADVATGQTVCKSASRIVEVLARCTHPPIIVCDALLGAMTRNEASWLAAGLAELLVPIRDSEGHVVAIITLAGKKDERPYSDHDSRLISGVCSAAEVAVERLAFRHPADVAAHKSALRASAASECAVCGLLHPSTHMGRCDACSNPLERASIPLLVAGKFRVERRVGRGGMAVVYCGLDAALHRRVAIKALQYLSAAAEQRLRAEARTMAAVSHTNVAAVYGLETWKRRPLLIAEYLERGTLADALKEGRVDIATIVDWGIGLAAGLTHLHRENIVHGDIKPSNIGFDRDGIPKLLDFGLSTTYRNAPSAAASHAGTSFYTCPEALASGLYLPEFDLWSLALVLYEALAGQALRSACARGRFIPPDIRELRADVPSTLAEFFMKALSSDVGTRPRSAAEFALWLRHTAPI